MKSYLFVVSYFKVIAFIILFLAGCQRNIRSSADSAEISNQRVDNQAASPLSVFWQDYDFANSSLLDNPDSIEQKIVDFIAAFSKRTDKEVGEAIGFVLQQSNGDQRSSNYF